MKKFLAIVLSLCMLFSFAACDKKEPSGTPAPVQEKESYTTTLEIENISAEAAMKGHVKCFNSKKELVWQYDTKQVYVGQLDNIQEIGMTSYGYLLLVDGDIICLGLEGENAGKEIWVNQMFGGASASWDFDEDENLYICGYFGPELVVVDPDGETKYFYPPQLVDCCYWPCGLEYDETDGTVIMEYENFDTKLKMDPKTGEFVEFVIEDASDYKNLLCGTWVDQIYDTRFYLGLDVDDNYVAFRDTEEECFAYVGTWTVSDEGALELPFTDYDDPFIYGLSRLGDYQITGFGVNEGMINMQLEQLNNGDSLTSLCFETYSPKLYKISAAVDYENPAARMAANDYSEAIGQWAAVTGEIEGWRYDVEEEGMEIRLSVLDNYTVSFSYTNKFNPEIAYLYTNMPMQFYDEAPYFVEPDRDYGNWYFECAPDDENLFMAVLDSEYKMEMLWFQGEWTDDSYPAVVWFELERTY